MLLDPCHAFVFVILMHEESEVILTHTLAAFKEALKIWPWHILIIINGIELCFGEGYGSVYSRVTSRDGVRSLLMI